MICSLSSWSGQWSRQYNNETTLELVYQRLLAEFDNLLASGHDSIAGMIEKCAATSLKLFNEMENDRGDSDCDDESDTDDDDEAIEVNYDEDDDDGNWNEGFGEGNVMEIEQI